MIVSARARFTADQVITANIVPNTAAPTLLSNGSAFGQDSKVAVNYGEREDVWVTLLTADGGANSVIVTPWAWNPNIGALSAGVSPAPVGAWIKLAALNAGAAITGTSGFVFEQQLPAEALCGKTSLYLQVASLANITTLVAYLRARTE